MHLSIDEALDVAQPAGVLPLLLDVDVIRHEDGEGLGDAALLEEPLHQDLEVLVERAEGGAGVDVCALLGVLGLVEAGDGGVLVEEDVLDEDLAVLGGGVDAQGTLGLAGLLDDDGQVDGGGGLLVDVFVNVLLLLSGGGVGAGTTLGLLVVGLDEVVLEGLLILERRVLIEGVVVGDIGDGEAHSDPTKLTHVSSSSPSSSIAF